MTILNLIVKKQYADEILNGLKKEETRTIRRITTKKYLVANPDTGIVDLRHYAAIKLFIGYYRNRTRITISVESIHLDFRSEKVMFALAKGVNINIVYKLGDIL